MWRLKIRKKALGFTLIELVFVMLLITLLTTFAAPRASNMLGFNLRTGASQVAGYLQMAYEYSIMHHERIRVRFDLSKNSYWVESFDESPTLPFLNENTKLDDAIQNFQKLGDEMNSLDGEEKKALEEKRFKKIESSSLKETSLPHDIRFKGVYTSAEGKVVETGEPWIDFFPGGFAPKTVVYVTNDSDQIYSIILKPLGGSSRVEKGEVRADEV